MHKGIRKTFLIRRKIIIKIIINIIIKFFKILKKLQNNIKNYKIKSQNKKKIIIKKIKLNLNYYNRW